MTFDEAMKMCRPCQLVKHRASSWNEHSVQYGVGAYGDAFWTAGFTVGGLLTEDRRPKDSLDPNGYQIFDFERNLINE